MNREQAIEAMSNGEVMRYSLSGTLYYQSRAEAKESEVGYFAFRHCDLKPQELSMRFSSYSFDGDFSIAYAKTDGQMRQLFPFGIYAALQHLRDGKVLCATNRSFYKMNKDNTMLLYSNTNRTRPEWGETGITINNLMPLRFRFADVSTLEIEDLPQVAGYQVSLHHVDGKTTAVKVGCTEILIADFESAVNNVLGKIRR